MSSKDLRWLERENSVSVRRSPPTSQSEEHVHALRLPHATTESVFSSDEVKETALESFALTLAGKHIVKPREDKSPVLAWFEVDTHGVLLSKLSTNAKFMDVVCIFFFLFLLALFVGDLMCLCACAGLWCRGTL